MKDAFITCQAEIQAKIISEPIITKTSVSTVNNPTQHQSSVIESQKKTSAHHNSKNDDDDFNEEDVED